MSVYMLGVEAKKINISIYIVIFIATIYNTSIQALISIYIVIFICALQPAGGSAEPISRLREQRSTTKSFEI